MGGGRPGRVDGVAVEVVLVAVENQVPRGRRGTLWEGSPAAWRRGESGAGAEQGGGGERGTMAGARAGEG